MVTIFSLLWVIDSGYGRLNQRGITQKPLADKKIF